MNSLCGSRMTILCRPPSTSPWLSQALRTRLTVCSVAPVISATSWRVIGKSICNTRLDLAAGLLREPEQGMGDAALDLLGRHLDHARMGILEPAARRSGGC